MKGALGSSESVSFKRYQRRMRSVSNRGVLVVALSLCGFLILLACGRSEGEVVYREVLTDHAVAQRYRSEALVPDLRPRPYGFAVLSPDTRLVLFHTDNRSACVTTLHLLDAVTGKVVPFVTIHDMDHCSGTAFSDGWSADSRAVLIRGGGEVASGRPRGRGFSRLCLAYLVAEERLVDLAPCSADSLAADP